MSEHIPLNDKLPRFDNQYDSWRDRRFKRIVKYFGEDFFKDKTLLEVGCAYGDLGNMFCNLGAHVTCTDGREDYVAEIKHRYPHISSYCHDLNNGLGTDQYFDIILHTGVLYHLETYVQPIIDACKQCDTLILETEVSNKDSDSVIFMDENGFDQSLTNKGNRPTIMAVETVLKSCNASYDRITDDLNSDVHTYDWLPVNEPIFRDGLRAFWICSTHNNI